jgi:hypothetical protein
MKWCKLDSRYTPHWLQASLGVRLGERAKVGQKAYKAEYSDSLSYASLRQQVLAEVMLAATYFTK